MFSENLVSLRKRAGLSQEDLANAIDVSRQTISKYETGAAEPILARLTKLSAFLNVSVDQLVAQPLAPVSATPATSSTGLMIKSALTGTLSAVIKFEIAQSLFPGNMDPALCYWEPTHSAFGMRLGLCLAGTPPAKTQRKKYRPLSKPCARASELISCTTM